MKILTGPSRLFSRYSLYMDGLEQHIKSCMPHNIILTHAAIEFKGVLAVNLNQRLRQA
jgi:hypothetical protein